MDIVAVRSGILLCVGHHRWWRSLPCWHPANLAHHLVDTQDVLPKRNDDGLPRGNVSAAAAPSRWCLDVPLPGPVLVSECKHPHPVPSWTFLRARRQRESSVLSGLVSPRCQAELPRRFDNRSWQRVRPSHLARRCHDALGPAAGGAWRSPQAMVASTPRAFGIANSHRREQAVVPNLHEAAQQTQVAW